MRKVRPVCACALGTALLLSSWPALAADSPAALFLHARRALDTPPDSAATLQAAQESPSGFLGRVFEIPATVTGVIAANGQETVMLTVSPQLTESVPVPRALLGSAWLENTGSRLRALVQVARTGNDQSLANLTLVAAAPEDDVEAADRQEQARAQASLTRAEDRQSRRTELLASRSLSFRRGEEPRAAFADPGQPDAPLSAAALRIFPAYHDAIRRLNARLSDGLVDTITTNILRFSDAYQVDPRLVMAMMIAESGFDIYSTSRTGAMGLGQLMPETARGLGVTNAYDPQQNIEASIRLLRGHLDQYGGQIALTMAAYNAGPGAVKKYHGVPPYRETRRYVAKVASLYRQLCGT